MKSFMPLIHIRYCRFLLHHSQSRLPLYLLDFLGCFFLCPLQDVLFLQQHAVIVGVRPVVVFGTGLGGVHLTGKGCFWSWVGGWPLHVFVLLQHKGRVHVFEIVFVDFGLSLHLLVRFKGFLGLPLQIRVGLCQISFVKL